ncbi:MAG: hypothetical protein RDU76_09000 [Candidatus Edwardsbacteria bacterium]|nr:hypothetical protein [Candidatus Edwardsbacteria bacterium]
MKISKLLLLVAITLLIVQKAEAQTEYLKSWSHTYWHTSISLKDQLNIKISAPMEGVNLPNSFETSLVSISAIEQNKKYYISANPLFIGAALGGAGLVNIFNKETRSPIYGIAAVAILAPQILGNFKIGFAPNSNIAFMAGQNTDYYLFYKISRICTESSIGIKLSNDAFRVTLDLRIPWTKGYFDNKQPYINFGIGYFPVFPNTPF